jgi:hypothetical protein
LSIGYPLSYLKSCYLTETLCAMQGLPWQAILVMSQSRGIFDQNRNAV